MSQTVANEKTEINVNETCISQTLAKASKQKQMDLYDHKNEHKHIKRQYLPY